MGTVDSGLNSMVLANNSEMVLLPINEPTFGTKRKSQIQTYLEQVGGRMLMACMPCVLCAAPSSWQANQLPVTLGYVA